MWYVLEGYNDNHVWAHGPYNTESYATQICKDSQRAVPYREWVVVEQEKGL